MTSKEIARRIAASSELSERRLFLEIALQLAIFNEREEKKELDKLVPVEKTIINFPQDR